MGKRPGERQSARSREALLSAFEGLLRTDGYSAVSVGLISEAADVGRSTFYRHFASKADLLVGLHERMFDRIFHQMSADAWLGDAPPPPLLGLVRMAGGYGGLAISLAADVGADMDYILGRVSALLASKIEESLSASFPDVSSTVPVEVAAVSVSGIYVSALMASRGRLKGVDAELLAAHIHRLTRALLREAYDCHQ